MKVNYNVKGAERKSLVSAISQQLNMPIEYFGVPTFAYKIGDYGIDKNGMVTGTDNRELVVALQSIYGFRAINEEYDTPVSESTNIEDYKISEHQTTCEDTLSIELPREGFTDTAVGNLRKLVESKSHLIKKAIGANNLEIEITDNTIGFPWFKADTSSEEVKAYTHLISAIGSLAKDQKRITAKEKLVDNEKYAFRCFLLRLGFIGPEYKSERKILLAKLEGNGAFKGKDNNATNITTETNETTITDTIVNQILAIRASGKYNMLSAKEVQREANERGFYELVVLIEEHQDIYSKFILNGKR